MSRRRSNTGAVPKDLGADRTRTPDVTPRVSEHDERIRVLDRMIAVLQRSSENQDFALSPTNDLHSPKLADELIGIHCTPMGVDTSLPPVGWEALAHDWERVGSYMRSVMPCFSKQIQT
ncbi:MAG: hypothetical protein OXN89_04980 [Bryobacterales bacterium]|nr:hypothetical protein [Bryobacterales bacterium]